ncbi:endonuclease [Bacillus sp. FJAT-47783]|uniref:endonuclease I family protein n=1 Tax=Bacillus sp. FJAT-47783 TaxID=2922712 RepID=UPI001FADFC5D|nr:endonuclease [Bacillus sp. FJAT-47783]
MSKKQKNKTPLIKHILEHKEWEKLDRTRSILTLLQNQEKIRKNPQFYYNAKKDEKDKASYYKNIMGKEVTGIELFYRYHHLIKHSHKNQLPYFLSKDYFLYTFVDLQPDGTVKSIYSNEEYNPSQIIHEDYEKIKKRYEKFHSLSEIDAHSEARLLKKMRTIDKYLKFNTEHIVPQSWFHAREPMKGDLHHLFICLPKCNVKRSNFHYHDFTFYEPESPKEKIRNACGVVKDGYFEPEHGKGSVARAMMYFLLRYPNAIKKSHLKRINLSLLINWHHAFPVTIYELHRNQAIYEIQGNRNPFIDFQHLIDKIEFPFL